jgi:hypothetical protein
LPAAAAINSGTQAIASPTIAVPPDNNAPSMIARSCTLALSGTKNSRKCYLQNGVSRIF